MQKEGDSSTSANTENEERPNSKPSKSSSEEEDNSENRSSHSKRMSKLEQRLEALKNQGSLQDMGENPALPSRMGYGSLPSQVQGTDSRNISR